jgi:hypothetical protein
MWEYVLRGGGGPYAKLNYTEARRVSGLVSLGSTPTNDLKRGVPGWVGYSLSGFTLTGYLRPG